MREVYMRTDFTKKIELYIGVVLVKKFFLNDTLARRLPSENTSIESKINLANTNWAKNGQFRLWFYQARAFFVVQQRSQARRSTISETPIKL